MKCPRCQRTHDVLQYIRLEMIEEFSEETTPCYKCPACKWIFAPADQMPQDLVMHLQQMISELESRLPKDDRQGLKHV